jgi:hypothetical protein
MAATDSMAVVAMDVKATDAKDTAAVATDVKADVVATDAASPAAATAVADPEAATVAADPEAAVAPTAVADRTVAADTGRKLWF